MAGFEKLSEAISAIVRARRAVEAAIEEASDNPARCLAVDEAQRELTQIKNLLMRYLPANLSVAVEKP